MPQYLTWCLVILTQGFDGEFLAASAQRPQTTSMAKAVFSSSQVQLNISKSTLWGKVNGWLCCWGDFVIDCQLSLALTTYSVVSTVPFSGNRASKKPRVRTKY